MKISDKSLQVLVDAFKGDSDEPLDGDEVDELSHIIKTMINRMEGNLTDDEYDKLLSQKYSSIIIKKQRAVDKAVGLLDGLLNSDDCKYDAEAGKVIGEVAAIVSGI